MAGEKFKNGFVLQTINNEFIKTEKSTITMLLEATEKVEKYLLITFPNAIHSEMVDKDESKGKFLFKNINFQSYNRTCLYFPY